jgi:serine/threonine protein kinase
LPSEYVTVKRLILQHDADQKIFHAEVDMLKRFGAGARKTSTNPQDRTYQHLITLLGTYSIGSSFFFIFPGVECSLEDYLARTPAPLVPRLRLRLLQSSDAATMRWLSEQILGLTAAVNLMHSESGLLGGGLGTPAKYARHGDLNMENIHWLKSKANYRGTLVIGDLGPVDVYGGHSYSGIPDEKPYHASIYCAPEYKIMDAGISRAYDIWSLGCIFLEIITWALGGNEERARFLQTRSEADRSWFETNVFFHTKQRGAKYVFMVKEQVTQVSGML